MMRLRLEMLQPLSITLFWKAQMSSEVAVSGERLRNAANRLQLSMWLLCVCRPRLRAIMSSIMRWRSGLMAAGVLFFEERIGLLLSTGEPRRTQDALSLTLAKNHHHHHLRGIRNMGSFSTIS